jgi:hypothetical protein
LITLKPVRLKDLPWDIILVALSVTTMSAATFPPVHDHKAVPAEIEMTIAGVDNVCKTDGSKPVLEIGVPHIARPVLADKKTE